MVPFKHQNDKLKGLIGLIVLDLKEKKSDIVGKSITIERRNRALTTMHMGGGCEAREDCIEKYGLGWYCKKECVDWDWDEHHNCIEGCCIIFEACMHFATSPELEVVCIA